MDTPYLLPHQDRLLRRIDSLETPLVQVWGWPGSGKSALLRALLEHQGAAARGLSLDEVEGSPDAGRSAASAERVRWLVAMGGSRERLAEVSRALHPRQRLVFAGERRWREAPIGVSLLAPQELLLQPGRGRHALVPADR